MTTLLFTHEDCLEHDAGFSHPERPDRLRAALAALDDETFSPLERRPAPKADREQIERVHASDYVSHILGSVPPLGHYSLDPDTALSPGSGEAALRAAGALCAAVDAVAGGEAGNAFCAVRPPGHHAEAARAMGFCLFNNVAIGARHAHAAHGLERVAVVDFDVHHGNGTQSAFERDGDFFFASSHQSPCYPGTGSESETGVGNIVNAELAPGSGSEAFRDAFGKRVLPALDGFAPEMILVSAGFDAHASDPLAQLNLTEDDFAWATREILSIAAKHCGGRVVSTLEGGYDLNALGASVAAHVAALMDG
ncbi:MAG: histone deacetylase family protein [Rhodospirillales bacterium]|jgi:acetoin utilization deacetylase AcuC-like enzyme|nr:histone deacetylase family protein [Rhodospirillales bacterium]MDP6882561.1 histone deacetylase family protein [Rhodospirillales bacterium]